MRSHSALSDSVRYARQRLTQSDAFSLCSFFDQLDAAERHPALFPTQSDAAERRIRKAIFLVLADFIKYTPIIIMLLISHKLVVNNHGSGLTPE